MADQYRTTAALRLRSLPQIQANNIIATLPTGTIVEEGELVPSPGWLGVRATINEKEVAGYVSTSYVIKVTETSTEETFTNVMPVNLPPMGTRSSTAFRASPLKELKMPLRDVQADTENKISGIYNILDFLNVENSVRYQPGNMVTFCNIYAYDFCCLANTYIPRVWWSDKALMQLSAGKEQSVTYGDTVYEINANSLYNWFLDFGKNFGWQRTFDTTDLQDEVNKGKVGIIVAQRKNLSLSGHIDMVIPETKVNKAVYDNAKVVKPLQSQAGAKNKKFFSSQWYLSKEFSGFAFWIHD